MKICKTCNTEKPYNEFHKHPDFKDGFMNTCKECKQKYYIERKANKPAKQVDWFIWD